MIFKKLFKYFKVGAFFALVTNCGTEASQPTNEPAVNQDLVSCVNEADESTDNSSSKNNKPNISEVDKFLNESDEAICINEAAYVRSGPVGTE